MASDRPHLDTSADIAAFYADKQARERRVRAQQRAHAEMRKPYICDNCRASAKRMDQRNGVYLCAECLKTMGND